MSVLLQIDDGDPWWLSPDIWTVPGSDPTGSPGSPVVGQPCYLWARVHNRGTEPIQGATVRFWWANPGTNFDRNTATQVGIAYVDLAAGETHEVLCLTAWDPSFVNGGHECVIAEAFHPSADPLPPGPDFAVPSDRHVAQRNLTVLVAPMQARYVVPFEIHNRFKANSVFEVKAEQGDLSSLERFGKQLSATAKLEGKTGKVKFLGFADSICPDPATIRKGDREIKLAGGSRTGLAVVFEVSGGPALVHVTQRHAGKVIGGLSVLALPGKEKKS